MGNLLEHVGIMIFQWGFPLVPWFAPTFAPRRAQSRKPRRHLVYQTLGGMTMVILPSSEPRVWCGKSSIFRFQGNHRHSTSMLVYPPRPLGYWLLNLQVDYWWEFTTKVIDHFTTFIYIDSRLDRMGGNGNGSKLLGLWEARLLAIFINF